jgi:hypothetical protein
MAFDTKSIAKAREYVDKAREKMARIREHAEEAIGTGIQIAEVGGTAFGFGYANARWGQNGEVKVMGVPADLGVAVALHGVAFMGGLGKYSEHGHNVGSGDGRAARGRTASELRSDVVTGVHERPTAAARGEWSRNPIHGPRGPSRLTTASNVNERRKHHVWTRYDCGS